MYLEERTHFEE